MLQSKSVNRDVQDHLLVIRTLMERAALYRRALAPVFAVCGALGIFAGMAGWFLKINQPVRFATWWVSTACFALAASMILIRRQAWKAGEPFWTPPARRLAEAMSPALLAGLTLTATISVVPMPSAMADSALVVLWHFSYGLALLSAGFFTPRGVRRLGAAYLGMGIFLLGEAFWFPVSFPSLPPDIQHVLMGTSFGLGHLLAAGWLRMTAPSQRL